MTNRKIIQISATTDRFTRLYALCDDGTLWSQTFGTGHEEDWKFISDIPQPRA